MNCCRAAACSNALWAAAEAALWGQVVHVLEEQKDGNVVCLDKEGVWKMELPFKMLKSRQMGFVCLSAKRERKIGIVTDILKVLRSVRSIFVTMLSFQLCLFITLWQGKTTKFFYVPNSSSHHVDQKGSESEGNGKAWYHRRDTTYDFLIHPFPGDLCYTVLLKTPTEYLNLV